MILSIIYVVYNKDYLSDSFSAIMDSSENIDCEIIIVNDGSDNETREYLLQYYMDTKKSRNTRLLENTYYQGNAISRNRAILESKGKYVAVHNHIDINLPNRLHDQIDFMNNNNSVMIGGHAINISYTNEHVGYDTSSPENAQQIYKNITQMKPPVIDGTVMFRREEVINNGGYNVSPQLDNITFELCCRLMSRNYLISNLQKLIIKQRMTEHNNDIDNIKEMCSKFRRRNFKYNRLQKKSFLQDFYTEYRM